MTAMRISPAHLALLATIDPRHGASSRPSVVHLLPSLGWGGAERLACTLHRLALDHGWTSRIDAPDLAVINEGIARELGTTPLPPRDREGDLVSWSFAARNRIALERPDVVHLHLPYPDRFAAGLLAARGRSLVATFHLLPEQGRTWSPDELIRQRSDRIVAILSRLAWRARFVTVSRTDLETLAQWVPRRRLVAIRNAPPLAPATEGSVDVTWPAGTRLLGVGRLVRQKGYDRLLTALGDPRLRSLAWTYGIVGAGPERDALEALARDLGIADRVRFFDELPARAVYPTADLVLSTSRWEGMPLVPLEAVEARVPIVVSDIGPHREIFADVPESILAADESAWPARLSSLIEHASHREQLGRAQRAALPADARLDMWNAYRRQYLAVAPHRSSQCR